MVDSSDLFLNQKSIVVFQKNNKKQFSVGFSFIIMQQFHNAGNASKIQHKYTNLYATAIVKCSQLHSDVVKARRC